MCRKSQKRRWGSVFDHAETPRFSRIEKNGVMQKISSGPIKDSEGSLNAKAVEFCGSDNGS